VHDPRPKGLSGPVLQHPTRYFEVDTKIAFAVASPLPEGSAATEGILCADQDVKRHKGISTPESRVTSRTPMGY